MWSCDVGLGLAGERAAVADHVGVRRDHVRRLVRREAGRGDRQPGDRRQEVGEDRVQVLCPAQALSVGDVVGYPECLKRADDHRRHLHRGLGGEQALNGRRGVAERVVGGGRNRSVAGGPVHAQAQRGDLLLPHRHGHDPAAVGELEQDSAAFVQGVVAAQVRALADQPGESNIGRVAFLVRLGNQHEVAGWALAGARERGQRDGPRGQLALHVGSAAADQQAVAHRPVERTHGPPRTRRRDHVGVGQQHHGRSLAAAAYARHQVEARWVRAKELDVGARAAQVLRDQLGGRRLVARRVRRVDPDQLLREAYDLLAEPGIAHPRSAASRRASSTGKASCIVPSSRSAGFAATRQLSTASCDAS